MWIHTDTAFVSIVAHDSKPDTVLVRARTRRDLEAFGVPDASIWADLEADYVWRSERTRAWLAQKLTEHAVSMDYTNVKSAVTQSVGEARHRVLLRCWEQLRDIEGEEEDAVIVADYARRGVPLPGWWPLQPPLPG